MRLYFDHRERGIFSPVKIPAILSGAPQFAPEIPFPPQPPDPSITRTRRHLTIDSFTANSSKSQHAHPPANPVSSQETALNLPRTYGVDDIPLGITSRRFLTHNAFACDHVVDNYGDYVLANGTLSPQVSLPKQRVRLRMLNAEVARGDTLGFSDNRTFYVITNDRGLLNAPVAGSRVKLIVRERIEILVNLGADPVGAALDLKASNSGQVFGFPSNVGNPVNPTGRSGPINGSLLNNTDFNGPPVTVGPSTASPVTVRPSALANHTYWTNANGTNPRTVLMTEGNGGADFSFDHLRYNPLRNNSSVALNDVETWTIVNNNIFGHSFYIHDVKLKIVARTPSARQVSSASLAPPLRVRRERLRLCAEGRERAGDREVRGRREHDQSVHVSRSLQPP